MKRLIAGIIALGSVLLMGCAPEYTLIVDNKSLHEVKFTMTIGYSEYKLTLAPNSQYIHPNSIPEALKNKEYIKEYEPKESVYFSYCDDIYTFHDNPSEEP